MNTEFLEKVKRIVEETKATRPLLFPPEVGFSFTGEEVSSIAKGEKYLHRFFVRPVGAGEVTISCDFYNVDMNMDTFDEFAGALLVASPLTPDIMYRLVNTTAEYRLTAYGKVTGTDPTEIKSRIVAIVTSISGVCYPLLCRARRGARGYPRFLFEALDAATKLSK